ncbi:hypothetical protein GCM10009661_62510 [Catellatospora chokoriensis]|uniref:Uncharacterized protein n=1 Tax=Catellatospora chokoriensis TaxID=310353 RepID=A0A8J3K0R4_9ACTN|nr:hypothetical protein Cch02nite_37960 [Catellatospora chokoriensis]
MDFGLNHLTEWVRPPHIDENMDFRTAADGSRKPLTLALHHWPSQAAVAAWASTGC